ncbi:minor tail protein [Gordonia phage SmokingBunny]|uniref:Minor tail protein n=2 Tax=Wizardvirus TaxID=2169658 RepID=A0A514CXD0_9CAUD|nr:minor tail protein [Gordonia phage SmokingBunny]YP_010103634.1 minor tail protein [Gordonia phage Nubi]QCG77841.1 minor tail protein [Gordonia phage SmokingBunny]QDH85163.1 minor tail protein [Gordonia phage Nubi]WAA20248.1 minor tail protein [Gordonia phage Togo]
MTCSSEISKTSNIRIVGCDGGDVHPIHGEDAGTTGVKLLKGGLRDLFEAPIRQIERTPVKMDGGVLRAVKTAIMEPVITVGISRKLVNEEFGVVDGAFREAFSFELDPYYEQSKLARIEWETEESTRWIEVVLAPGQSYDADLVPHEHGSWIWEIHLKAYDPFWHEEEGKPAFAEFTTPGTKTLKVSNPTGVDMAPTWVTTRGQVRLPDNTWTGKPWNRAPGGAYPTRTLLYPNITNAMGGLVATAEPGKVPVRDAFDHNLTGQMPVQGDFPKNLIPRFTQRQDLTVQAVQVPAGGMRVECRQPRRFRKPWGRV